MDDFSTQRGEWELLGPGTKIDDGSLILYSKDNIYGEQGITPYNAQDFVIEYEFLLEHSGENPPTDFLFRAEEACKYVFEITPVLEANSTASWKISFGEEMISSGSTNLYRPKETNKVTVVAQGDHFAIFLKNAPLAYIQDSACKGAGGAFFINIPQGEAWLFIDELRIWQLE